MAINSSGLGLPFGNKRLCISFASGSLEAHVASMTSCNSRRTTFRDALRLSESLLPRLSLTLSWNHLRSYHSTDLLRNLSKPGDFHCQSRCSDFGAAFFVFIATFTLQRLSGFHATFSRDFEPCDFEPCDFCDFQGHATFGLSDAGSGADRRNREKSHVPGPAGRFVMIPGTI